jgi:DNA polymerase-3 subunit beta
MKCSTKKADIQDVLAKIQSLAGRKTNLAITTNVLIRSDVSEICLIATDLETGFEGHYPADVTTPGSIAINAKKLFEIIKEFPSEDILLNETENQWIEISNKKVEFHLMGMNPEEFPEHPQIEDATLFEVDSGALSKMIDQTVIVSGASDDRRAHITGVLMEILKTDEGPLFRLVSTDGSRLSKVDYSLTADVALPDMPTIIIPKKGLSEVGKFLEPGGSVQLGIKNNNFIVKKENETIIVRLLEGEFPKYQEIIARPDKAVPALLDKKAFQKTLRRMSILSSENYKGIIFNFETDRLEIRANNPEIGESKEELGIEYQGDKIEAAFNPRFFTETLAVIEGDQIKINLTDSERPCLVEGQEDQRFLSVIMPMRI